MDYDLLAAGVQAPTNFKPFAHRESNMDKKQCPSSSPPHTISLNMIKFHSGKSRAPSNDLSNYHCNDYYRHSESELLRHQVRK